MTVKAWNYILNRFINGGYFSSAEGIAASVTPGLMYFKNAGAVMQMFDRRKDLPESTEVVSLVIPPYSGKNEFVREMKEALSPLKDILHSAYVHGSLATDEVIPYSDFDGLLILKDELFSERNKLAKAAKRLNDLRFYMHRLDPLQHHGWFVLSEVDLNDYHENFLPVETLKYARSIFPDQEVQLQLKVNPAVDYRRPFFRLCQGLEKKLSAGPDKYNLYSLKSILSEFMMLAPLYVQAKRGKGIFKKFAFEEMRRDFQAEDFSVMDAVSSIRSKWNVQLSEKEKRFLERTDFYSWYRRKHIQYDIPSFLKEEADDELFIRMKLLTITARKKIEQS